ncbi:MAG: histidinol-phosphate transaminase, partial [Fidelibacterota bacterium]
SRSNFFLFTTPLGARETFARLVEADILVRDVSDYPGCASLLRATVGTPAENEALIQAVEALL